MKNIKKLKESSIAIYLITIIGVIALSLAGSYLCFLLYGVVGGFLTFLPHLTFWQFFLVLLLIKVIFGSSSVGGKKK